MKKLSLFVAILLIIGLASFAYAESSATAMSGKSYREQQVFVIAYNNSGTDITSNYVVILDTTNGYVTSGSTLGAYIDTTTSTGSALVLGVTDEVIENGTAGRICVRGPHKCMMIGSGNSATLYAAGATVGTTTTAGKANGLALTSDSGAVPFGVSLYGTAVTTAAEGLTPGENGDGNLWWIYIRPNLR